MANISPFDLLFEAPAHYGSAQGGLPTILQAFFLRLITAIGNDTSVY